MKFVSSLRLCTLVIAVLVAGCEKPAPEAASAAPEQPEVNGANQSVEPACEEVGGVLPVCGFRNPEDLVVVPGGELLLVSEMAPFMSDAPSTLAFLDIASQRRVPAQMLWSNTSDHWGDEQCTTEPATLSPHGIDLITRPDGRHQLLVVNHGTEAIEFFELLSVDGQWQLQWKGCAKPEDDLFMNDVAALQDGGFFVTHMWNKSMPFEEVVAKLTAGEETGWVMEWQPGSGFTKVPDSDELMPNGIAVSADNSKIYVNIYMGNKTLKLDRLTGKVEGQMAVKNPDNIVVDAEGNLWVASHLNDPVEGRCEDDHKGPCLLPFQIIKASPDDMLPHVAFSLDGPPMGYATVGLPHNGRLYFGSANGDRVASVAIAPSL